MAPINRCSLTVGVLLIAAGVVYRLAISYLLAPISARAVDLTGQLAIVTGGTSGIGLEAARFLVGWNATVVLCVRNQSKAQRVKADLEASAGLGGSMELWDLDFANLASVRSFAASWVACGRKADILMNNAGMRTSAIQKSVDGIELTYQVNHLGPFLLTEMLIPSLGRGSRIVHTSSSVHYFGSVLRDAYSAENKNLGSYGRHGFNAYYDTKLFNVVYSMELNARLNGTGIISNVVHPGFVISNLDYQIFGGGIKTKVMKFVRGVAARDTPSGALTQTLVATDPDLSQGGLYYEDRCIDYNCKACFGCDPLGGVRPHSSVHDRATQEWLLQTSRELVGLTNSKSSS